MTTILAVFIGIVLGAFAGLSAAALMAAADERLDWYTAEDEPAVGERVLATVKSKDGTEKVAIVAWKAGGHWKSDGGSVIAWMPLPAPYGGELGDGTEDY